MTRRLKMYLAKRRLQKMVERNRRSFVVMDYGKRRQAALKGLGR